MKPNSGTGSAICKTSRTRTKWRKGLTFSDCLPSNFRFKIVCCQTRAQQGRHRGDNSFGLIVLVLENSVELFSINWLFIICFHLQSKLCPLDESKTFY